MYSSNLKKNNLFQNLDEEIDLSKLLRIVSRNKKFIGSITFIFFIIACFYSLTLKRVWEGQFEIVLDSKSNNMPNLPKAFSNLAGITSNFNSNNLKTEIGILESPSVLMPIFNFVKENQKLKNQNLIFPVWKKDSVIINLKEETSILNIAYRDTNKELILPVLNKMSQAYQKYSGKSQRRSKEIANKYLMNQIDIFKEKSSNSFQAAQEFAIDQDLFFIGLERPSSSLPKDNLTKVEQNSLNREFISNIGIESIRIQAVNEIKKIDSQLESIDDVGNDSSKLQYIIATMNLSETQNKNLLDVLLEVEEEILIQSSKYTLNDPKLKNLIYKREILFNSIKNRTKSILESQRLVFESRKNSASRPKDILIKYKELIREAERDESTLVSLENQLRLVQLEKSRSEDPWELITEPNLLEKPVAPSRRSIATLGLLLGFFLSFMLSILKEKKSDIIYDIENLEDNLPYPFFKINLTEKENSINHSLNLLKEYISDLKIKNLSFLYIGDISGEKKEFIKNQFINYFDFKDEKEVNFLTFDDKYQEFTNTKEKFVIISKGYTKYHDITLLKERLNLFNIKLSGVIVE